jgi:hypothetical protein
MRKITGRTREVGQLTFIEDLMSSCRAALLDFLKTKPDIIYCILINRNDFP